MGTSFPGAPLVHASRHDLAQADEIVELRRSLIAGRAVVASGLGNLSAYGGSIGSNDTLKRHVALASCSDVRVGYSAATYLSISEADAPNPVLIKASIVVGGTIVPLTFGGKQQGQLDPGGFLLSDPAGVDLTVGDVFFTRTREDTQMGIAIALSSNITAGDTSFQTATAPTAQFLFSGGVVTINGTTSDTVTVANVTGTGPYTWTLKSGTVAHSHTTANTVSQSVLENTNAYTDRSEGQVFNNADLSYSGSFPAIGQNVIHLAVAASIGDTKISMSTHEFAPTITINLNGGNEESVAVKAVVVDGAGYTAWLASPLTQNHLINEIITAQLAYLYSAGAFGPTVIVADRVKPATARPRTIVGLGDSIAQGTGYETRAITSWMNLAFEGVKPFASVAIGGESGATFATLAGSKRRRGLFSIGDWVLYAYGANDLGLTGAQILANTLIVAQIVKNRGLKFACCTVTPHTTGTANGGTAFLTTGGQTVTGNEQHRIDYNTLVRAGNALFDLVVDVANTVEVNAGGALTQNGGFWFVDGVVPYTMEGLHPTVPGHTKIAAGINTGLFS